MADYARITENKGGTFRNKDFLDSMNTIGNIPVSQGHWELTGIDPFSQYQ